MSEVVKANTGSSSGRKRGRPALPVKVEESKKIEEIVAVEAPEPIVVNVPIIEEKKNNISNNNVIKEGKRDRRVNTVFADYADPFKFMPEKSKAKKGNNRYSDSETVNYMYGDTLMYPTSTSYQPHKKGSTSLLNSILNSSSGGLCSSSGAVTQPRPLPNMMEPSSRPQQVPRHLPKERIQISLTANGHAPPPKDEAASGKQTGGLAVKKIKGTQERSRKRSRGMPPVSVFSGITANRDHKKKLYTITGLEQQRGKRGAFVARIFEMIDAEYKESALLIKALLTEIAVKYINKRIDRMACASMLQYVLRERSEIFCEMLDLWSKEMELEEAEKAEQDLLAAQQAAAEAQQLVYTAAAVDVSVMPTTSSDSNNQFKRIVTS